MYEVNKILGFLIMDNRIIIILKQEITVSCNMQALELFVIHFNTTKNC